MHFVFADHTLDTDRRELRRGSQLVAVEPQVFDLLVYLVQNRDRVVSKDDLIASVWKGRIVSESTLTSRINAARTAIGDNGKEQKLIRTVARKGLRFVGVVQRTQPALSRRGSPIQPTKPSAASPVPPSDRPAIAVLPFTNMSGDPEQEYFSDGISEDIITALSKLRWFLVIARNSSFVYKGKAVHMKQIAEELGVGYVVEGSVRKSGDHVRITAQLNDVSDRQPHLGRALRSQPYGCVCRAGRHHRVHRCRDRAAALCRGKLSRPAQTARQHGCLGSGDAGTVVLLARDTAGQCRRAGAA